MSERIRVESGWQAPVENYYQQECDFSDVRYTGILPKKRFHPRLIVRKFRTDSQQSAAWGSQFMELDNFILESVDESVEEKYQIIQTFGPDFIFFYGTRPRIFHYSGRLFNTAEKPWKNDWQRAWDRKTFTLGSGQQPNNNDIGSDSQRAIIAGSNVVLQGGIARLEYDGSIRYSASAFNSSIGATNLNYPDTPDGEMDRAESVIVREGYLLSLHISFNSNVPNTANFRFSMFVTNSMNY